MIENYTINEDGSIDVNGDVWIQNSFSYKFPIKFRHVSGDFFCRGNELTTLEGCPESIDGGFYCSGNQLKTLVGGPKSLTTLSCGGNKIRTFDGFPICDKFYCDNNPIHVFWYLFKDETKVELFNDFGITDGEVVILDRLNDFLEMIGKPIVKKTYITDIKKSGYKIV